MRRRGEIDVRRRVINDGGLVDHRHGEVREEGLVGEIVPRWEEHDGHGAGEQPERQVLRVGDEGELRAAVLGIFQGHVGVPLLRVT